MDIKSLLEFQEALYFHTGWKLLNMLDMSWNLNANGSITVTGYEAEREEVFEHLYESGTVNNIWASVYNNDMQSYIDSCVAIEYEEYDEDDDFTDIVSFI